MLHIFLTYGIKSDLPLLAHRRLEHRFPQDFMSSGRDNVVTPIMYLRQFTIQACDNCYHLYSMQFPVPCLYYLFNKQYVIENIIRVDQVCNCLRYNDIQILLIHSMWVMTIYLKWPFSLIRNKNTIGIRSQIIC